MKYFNWLWLCLTSQRGEEEGQLSGSGEESAEGQGASQAVAEGEQERPVDVEALTRERDEYKSKHETLSGQSRATEQNLAATRRALEANGLRMVKDADGNVQVVPMARQSQGGRFTDEHKNKFFSYFPDQKSGEEFLNILDLMFGDRMDSGFKNFRGEMTKEQQFSVERQQSIDRMYSLFPQLNAKGESFNKAFYEKADKILVERYIDPKTGNPLFAHADLIAANEAAIEMGIAPASVAAAEKKGFEKGKEQKKIVGSVQGSQSQGGQGGFRKLSYDEYSKLPSDQKAEYDKKEIESRKGK